MVVLRDLAIRWAWSPDWCLIRVPLGWTTWTNPGGQFTCSWNGISGQSHIVPFTSQISLSSHPNSFPFWCKELLWLFWICLWCPGGRTSGSRKNCCWIDIQTSEKVCDVLRATTRLLSIKDIQDGMQSSRNGCEWFYQREFSLKGYIWLARIIWNESHKEIIAGWVPLLSAGSELVAPLNVFMKTCTCTYGLHCCLYLWVLELEIFRARWYWRTNSCLILISLDMVFEFGCSSPQFLFQVITSTNIWSWCSFCAPN